MFLQYHSFLLLNLKPKISDESVLSSATFCDLPQAMGNVGSAVSSIFLTRPVLYGGMPIAYNMSPFP